MTLRIVLGLLGGLAATWLLLVGVLLVAMPKEGLLKEALRLLPDVIRLLKRLAADGLYRAGYGSCSACCSPTSPFPST